MNTRTILIADDEPTIRTYIRKILVDQGFQVIEAIDGMDALAQAERHSFDIDLLLTDIRMPRMDGIALARSLVQVNPATPVLFISGYPFDIGEAALSGKGKCGSLAKPFTRK